MKRPGRGVESRAGLSGGAGEGVPRQAAGLASRRRQARPKPIAPAKLTSTSVAGSGVAAGWTSNVRVFVTR